MSSTPFLTRNTDELNHGRTSSTSTPKLKILIPSKVQIQRKIRNNLCLTRMQCYLYIVIIIIVMFCLITHSYKPTVESFDYTINGKFIESQFEASLMLDKGTGCEMPETDPFAPEIMQYDKDMPKVRCKGIDWVKCYLSECKVVDKIVASMRTISCTYYDIIYDSDFHYHYGAGVKVLGKGVYTLTNSDHVMIRCTGEHVNSFLKSLWTGHGVGFRTQVERIPSPPGREDNINVLMFGFDSTSRNGFIRKMPKSYDFLMKELDGTLFTSYNALGEDTPSAMFPILVGHSEVELPSVRRSSNNPVTMDDLPFIFKKMKADGFRTAYFEDMPWIGTFQYRFNGFLHQPSDHFLRAFLSDATKNRKLNSQFCLGSTPGYEVLMNITEQFFKLDGKKFALTFIADITHDNFLWISTADDATTKFLRALKNGGHLENTLLVVMGDHGSRYGEQRNTIPGKLEMLQPLLFIRLPERLRRERASAMRALKGNARALITPHDLRATILDALGMRQYWNMYKVPGASLPRGMSLLEPIPRNRSCSEVGIAAHYCVCLTWRNVSHTHKFYEKTAHVLVDYINALIQPKRDLCLPRNLTSIEWLLELQASNNKVSFIWEAEEDSFVKNFTEQNELKKHTYQVKIVVGPGNGVYEATMVYIVDDDRFIIETSDISRVSAYGNEPYCISATDPHLNPFCYCRNYQPNLNQTFIFHTDRKWNDTGSKDK